MSKIYSRSDGDTLSPTTPHPYPHLFLFPSPWAQPQPHWASNPLHFHVQYFILKLISVTIPNY